MRDMKDSGIEWIGKIPVGWGITKTKHYCKSVFAGGTPDTGKPEYWDGDISWLPSGSVQNCIIDKPVRYITNLGLEKSSTKMIPANTTLLAMTGATCSNVGFLTFDSCANQSVTAFLVKDTTYSKYIFYLLLASKEQILLKQTGGAQGGINVEDCKNIIVPYIKFSEQKIIADHLDKECVRIDGLVEKQRSIIEKLKKYKKSVITEAVTCGLNPDAPMKDSGIEWIGNIPEHWEVRKLNMLADVFGRIGFRGYTQNDLVAENEGAITLSPSNISDMFANYNKCSYLSWYKYNESPEIQIHNNDIIFVKTGSSYGKSCLITNLPKEATINPQLIVFKNLKIDPKLFLYMLQSESTEHQIQLIVVGGTIPTMSQEKIKKIVFVLPPMEEQREILYYLDQKCAEIDSVIEKREKMIELLTEYKKSLIYECVTGKKEIVDVVE